MPIADGLFMVNLGEPKAGPDSFHVISSKFNLTVFLCMMISLTSMGSLSTKMIHKSVNVKLLIKGREFAY